MGAPRRSGPDMYTLADTAWHQLGVVVAAIQGYEGLQLRETPDHGCRLIQCFLDPVRFMREQAGGSEPHVTPEALDRYVELVPFDLDARVLVEGSAVAIQRLNGLLMERNENNDLHQLMRLLEDVDDLPADVPFLRLARLARGQRNLRGWKRHDADLLGKVQLYLSLNARGFRLEVPIGRLGRLFSRHPDDHSLARWIQRHVDPHFDLAA